MFETLKREIQVNIFNALTRVHQHVRLIDFEEVAALSSEERNTTLHYFSDRNTDRLLDRRKSLSETINSAQSISRVKICLPEWLLDSYTTLRAESLLGVYYGIVQERMEKGAELNELKQEQEQMMREAEAQWRIQHVGDFRVNGRC
ncbi:hypothetical protein Moror_5277 [Moniliophthora roreri MCA 2997]|nr:hypothetical protein Moror_5277 [Moniliophthora roreri MCA 2997]